MIILKCHDYLEAYHLKVSDKRLNKLEAISMAAGTIDTDWDLSKKDRIRLSARIAQDYYRALEKAMEEAEVIPEADEADEE